MKHFNTTDTVYCNLRHYRRGHLLQGRYNALLVDADSHLLERSRYDHLNPVRVLRNASLSLSEKREILQICQWSSYGGDTAWVNAGRFLIVAKYCR